MRVAVHEKTDSTLEAMPPELLAHVARYLDPKSFANLWDASLVLQSKLRTSRLEAVPRRVLAKVARNLDPKTFIDLWDASPLLQKKLTTSLPHMLRECLPGETSFGTGNEAPGSPPYVQHLAWGLRTQLRLDYTQRPAYTDVPDQDGEPTSVAFTHHGRYFVQLCQPTTKTSASFVGVHIFDQKTRRTRSERGEGQGGSIDAHDAAFTWIREISYPSQTQFLVHTLGITPESPPRAVHVPVFGDGLAGMPRTRLQFTFLNKTELVTYTDGKAAYGDPRLGAARTVQSVKDASILGVSPDKRYVVISKKDKQDGALLWDHRRQTWLSDALPRQHCFPGSVRFSQDSSFLALCTSGHKVSVWQLGEAGLARVWGGVEGRNVIFAPNSQALAFVEYVDDGCSNLTLVNLQVAASTTRTLFRWGNNVPNTQLLRFSPNGRFLAATWPRIEYIPGGTRTYTATRLYDFAGAGRAAAR